MDTRLDTRRCENCLFLSEKLYFNKYICLSESNKNKDGYLKIYNNLANCSLCGNYVPAPKQLLEDRGIRVKSRFELMIL